MPRLFAYIVKNNTGFAPNPYFKYCTLACCKPEIRRVASEGDYVVGISPKASGNNLIYAMRIDEKLTFEKYWRDERFESKKPSLSEKQPLCKFGDNIYKPLRPDASEPNDFQQLPSMHSNGQHENLDNKAHDLKGKHVLIAHQGSFVYLSSKSKDLPGQLRNALLPLRRGHRSRFPDNVVSAFHNFFQDLFGRYSGKAPPPTASRILNCRNPRV